MLRALTQKVKKIVGLEVSGSVAVTNTKSKNNTNNFEEAVEMVRPTLATVAAVTSKVFSPLKPHTPLIRFRKGGPVSGHGPSAPGHASSSSSVPGSTRTTSPGEALEDWQLPQRYRRRQIDENEIAYINRGGPDI